MHGIMSSGTREETGFLIPGDCEFTCVESLALAKFQASSFLPSLGDICERLEYSNR
jgi:hypothetical protein